MSPEYRPQSYWSARLKENFSIRGTGHLDYDRAYNVWLYRAKGRALKRATAAVPDGAAVLDIGSGVGWVIGRLLAQGLEPEGCDIAPEAVARLSERFPQVPFFTLALGDERIPRPDGAYAAATMLDVAYHVVDDEKWLAGLAEVARVLRPGGSLIVSDGLGDADRSPAEHVLFRSLNSWRRAEEVGLRVTRVLPYFRWLSRDRDASVLRRLPDGARGAIEFALESAAPRAPHMRCAVLTK
jgi:SAM-dependent methyltransferase